MAYKVHSKYRQHGSIKRVLSLWGTTFLVFLIVISCYDPQPLTPLSTEISGPLHGYYAIADSSCLPSDDSVSIHILRLKSGLPSPWKKKYRLGYADQTFEMAFSFELCDTAGHTCGYTQTDLFRDRETLKAIADLKEGDTAIVSFPVQSSKCGFFRMGSVFNVNLAADRPNHFVKSVKPPLPQLDVISTPDVKPMVEEIKKEVREREEAERRAAEERARLEEERRRAEEAEEYDDSPWDVIRESSQDIYHEATRKMREWLGFDE